MKMSVQYRLLLLLPLLATLGLPGPARSEIYELPPEGHDVIGSLTTVTARAEDTLLALARRHGLGYEDIVRANPGVDAWLPGEGTAVLLPTRFVLPPGPRRGIVLNLAEYRMYYYPAPRDGESAVVMTYPMSIGRMDWETPLGRARIVAKSRNPTWYPPDSVRREHEADGRTLPRAVPPGPDNPLGAFAMRLNLPAYLIHGTNRPAGVGMRVTHGCIRMFPEDIEFLFEHVPVETQVMIINEPIKMGWDGEELVLEVHRTLDAAPVAAEEAGDGVIVDVPAIDSESPAASERQVEPPIRERLTALTVQFVAATSSRAGELDWDFAETLLERADGIPAGVGRSIKNAATSAASE